MNVFISYRRDDSGPTARLLKLVLSRLEDVNSVFMDLDEIPYGGNFETLIREHLDRADVVLAIVGPQWARMVTDRLKGPDTDWVRREIAIALEREALGRLRAVPVFVDGAALRAADLPDDIARLAGINGPHFETRASDEGEIRIITAVRGESDAQRGAREKAERRTKAWAVAAGLGVFLASWMQLFDAFGLDSHVHHGTLWLAHRAGALPLPPDAGAIAIVELDDATEAAQPSRTQRRAALAAVVTQAAAAGAKSLAMDFEFDEILDPTADAVLEAALASARPTLPVLLGVRAGIGARGSDGPQPAVLARFLAHAGWALACVGERGGVVSTLPLVVQRPPPGSSASLAANAPPARTIPSLGLAAFIAARGLTVGELRLGTLRLELERGGVRVQDVGAFAVEELRRDPDDCTLLRQGDLLMQQWLDERAPAHSTIGTRVRMADLLRGEPAALAALKDRIVIAGDFRTSNNDDKHQTASGAMQGSALIAAQVDGLLRGSAIRPLTALEQGLLMVGATFGGAALTLPLRGAHARWFWTAVAVIGVAAVLAAAGTYRGFRVLFGPHYVLMAWLVGALLARRLRRR